jgi:hypothetical protein
MTDGPIFVGGLDRTGTSLMYALLASHPDVAMSRRTNWWTYFYGRYGDLREPRNLDRLLSVMGKYRRHRKLEPDLDALRHEFEAGDRDYGRLFALLQEQRARRLGRTRWGDKSLHTERHADTVFRNFPDARILHMVRDPRDRYASVLKRWGRVRGGAGASAAAWVASVRLAEHNLLRYPDRYRIVRYEDLVSEPLSAVAAICSFAGLPFIAEMLELRGDAAFAEGGNSSYGSIPTGTISTRSVGRYREVLDPHAIRFIEARAGTAMRRHGYSVGDGGAKQWDAGYAAAWPKLFGAMLAWQVRERVYDVIGRTVSPRTLIADELA